MYELCLQSEYFMFSERDDDFEQLLGTTETENESDSPDETSGKEEEVFESSNNFLTVDFTSTVNDEAPVAFEPGHF